MNPHLPDEQIPGGRRQIHLQKPAVVRKNTRSNTIILDMNFPVFMDALF